MLPAHETKLVDASERGARGLTLELLHHIMQLSPHELVLVRLHL